MKKANFKKYLIYLGALFDKEDETLIKAFTSAVELVNSDEELLPNMTLVPISFTGIPEFDSLEVGKKGMLLLYLNTYIFKD